MINVGLDQTTYGKAYEFACLQSLVSAINNSRKVVVIENSSLLVARNAWDTLSEDKKLIMSKSSMAGVLTLIQLEPKILEDGNDELELSLQEDRRGEEGDVRDVLIIRRKILWEIGISVKHNHTAVKHSRLSPTIDFGKEWLNLPCSKEYFEEITPIFNYVNRQKQKQLKWKDLTDKNEAVYIPLLNAFMNELNRLNSKYPGEVPSRLLEYLLGRKDFYKIISNDSNKSTTLQCFNLHNSLNTASNAAAPALKVKGVNMPSLIYHLEFKNTKGEISTNTIQLVMDNNWAISFRIHSASTNVENSLKFDIQLTGVPSHLFSNTVSW